MKLHLSAAAVVLLSGLAGAQLAQYTPNQADWSTFQSKAIAGSNTAHDPDGVGWISEANWEAAEWDGTVYNPSLMTRSEFANAICPSVDRIRGIREVFYQHNPFADPLNPTKAEVDEWHRIALNHVRALIGYTSEDRQVKKDHCMFARALWGQQRRFTTMWDADYPGSLGSAAGPCVGATNGNSHCGATFLPDAADQAPYLPAGHAPCTLTAGSEGVFSGPKSNIPWSLKWSRGLCNTLMAEGFWGGHVGPFFHREKFGFSFWDNNPSNNNNNAILRAKWTGTLMPNLYCNPSDADCVPNANECTSNTHDCDVNAVCQDNVGSFTCSCEDGFVGDGTSCEPESMNMHAMIAPSADGDLANWPFRPSWEGGSPLMFADGGLRDGGSLSFFEFQGVPASDLVVSANLTLDKVGDHSDPTGCGDRYTLVAGVGDVTDAALGTWSGVARQTFAAAGEGKIELDVTNLLERASRSTPGVLSLLLFAEGARCKAAFATKEHMDATKHPKLAVEYALDPVVPARREAVTNGEMITIVPRSGEAAVDAEEVAEQLRQVEETGESEQEEAAIPPRYYLPEA